MLPPMTKPNMQAVPAGSVSVQEGADVAALLRRLGVTIWEICTGDQPKRGQLRACRRAAPCSTRQTGACLC